MIEHLADLGVDLKITGNGGNGAAQFGEGGTGDTGGSFLQQSGATKVGTEFRLEAGGGFAGFAEGILRDDIDLRADFLDLFLGDDAGIEQAAGEETADRGVLIDLGVEGGLGEVWLVALVVPVFPVADDVEDDVLVELLAKLQGHLDDGTGGEGVVTVDMKDGETEGFGGGGTVAGGAGVDRKGGEGDLVVDDDMNGAAGLVALELREIEGFRHHALADKGSVAVDEDRKNLFAVHGVFPVALAGPGFAFHDGVHGLEVAGVGGEGDADLFLIRGDHGVFVTEVVLHVPVAQDGFGDVVFVKLGEEFPAGFTEGVDEDVQAPPVGHADHNLLDAVGGASLEQGIEGGDEGFPAFQGKTFLTDVASVEEALEGFGGDNFFEDAALLFVGEDGLVAVALHPVAKPAADGEVHDVHELDPEGAAVGFAEVGENIPESARAAAAEGAGVESAVEVGIGEAEGGKREIGILVRGDAEGVEVGEGVAEGTVGEEEIVKAGLGKNVASGDGSGGTIAGWGAELAAEFKPLKKAAPDRLDRSGIRFPLFVKIFEEGGVARLTQATEGGGWGGGGAVGVQAV